MNETDVRHLVEAAIHHVAPEADISSVDPAADLRDELDIDSMDFLNLVTALHERLDLDIPEIDYPNLATFGHTVDYLTQRLASAP